MKLNKRLHIIAVLALLIVAMMCVLTACGDDNKDNNNTNDGNNGTNTEQIVFTEISTMEELLKLNNSSENYKLKNDIDISGVSNWSPIVEFSGVLDGNGFSITGLTISSIQNNIGLFSSLKGTVQNLKVTDVNIKNTGDAENIGAICGQLTNNGKLDNVLVTGTISAIYGSNVGGLSGKSNGAILNCTNEISVVAESSVGGIIGYGEYSSTKTLENNTNNAVIKGTSNVGGIIGYISAYTNSPTFTITNCINKQDIVGSKDSIGGIIGYFYGYKIVSTNCQNLASITGKDNVGGIFGNSTTGSISTASNIADITGENYVGGYVGRGDNVSIEFATNENVITGNAYVGGIAGRCASLNNCTNNGNVISQNIIIQDNVGCSYIGGIAGRSSSINNCTNNSDIVGATGGNYVGGISGYIESSKTMNGNTNNASVSGSANYVGGIAGYFAATATYEVNDNTNNGVVNGNASVGGLFGYISAYTNSPTLTMSNCVNKQEVVGNKDNIGGIVGYYYGYKVEITNCKNMAEITGKNNVGGLIGLGTTGSISTSSNIADITGENYVGGYIGRADNTSVKFATNENAITGNAYVGGIAGRCGSLDNCTNNGQIKANRVIVESNVSCTYIGGVAGRSSSINNCTNNSDIVGATGGNYVGGISGYIESSKTMNGNINNASVAGTGDYVGGIAGYFAATATYEVNDNTNNGVVNGNTSVGGLFGCISAYTNSPTLTMSNCVNKQEVVGNKDNVAGIVGYYYGYKVEITGCKNMAEITGKNNVGGLIGLGTTGSISTSSNIADITGENYVGGYIGRADNTSIKFATNENTITGNAYVGGIAGRCASINDCTNNGKVVSLGVIVENKISCTYIGGIAGRSSSINNCTNNTDITGATGGSYVGGICGYVESNKAASGNANNAKVTGTGDYIGGIVGYYVVTGTCEISDNTNSGSISGNNYVSGLFGYIYAYTNSPTITLSNCVNQGTVVGSNSYVSGLIARFYGYKLNITNCQNSSDISGMEYVAGIIAYGNNVSKNEAIWASNTNYGIITGDSNTGDLYGKLE